jgi:predicted patatin/cPLA2 family phospholipase
MKKQYLCIVKNIKMQITSNTGLVLEGGGMRGVFTSGVLDAFMKHEVYFPYVVAVSAGACNGLSYMSHQPRRARWSNIDMLQKYDYISLKSLIVNGSIFDPELIYERFPNEFFPFDYDAYEKNPATFEVVTTNCRTGRAMYLTERHDHRRLTQLIRATSSLPFVAHITRVDCIPMLDGGIVDSIPILRSIDTGHQENVVVMTRNRGYRSSEPDIKIPKFLYGEYPRLRVALSRRTAAYNEQLDLVERMEDWGEIVVIRPQKPLEVGRITEDVAKLERLYEEGFQQGEQFILSAGLA